MKIGIDISQLAYPNTGVANYLINLVQKLIETDHENEYILFYSSLRRNFRLSIFNFQPDSNVQIKKFRIPPTILSFLWNTVHIVPIEWLIGDIDIFITSDWSEPPAKHAKKVTILYDLIVYKYPEETHNQIEIDPKKLNVSANIVSIQKKKLSWVTKECSAILCISESTKKDARELLSIDNNKLHVIYPGFTL